MDPQTAKTVCGLSWLDNYLKALLPEDREKVVQKRSKTNFRFGDVETAVSLKPVIIPATLNLQCREMLLAMSYLYS